MYTIRAALGILSSTQCLQELKIGHLHPPEEMSPPMPVAFLPNLKFLEYTGQPFGCATFLDHIEIPLDCQVQIPHCRGELPNFGTEEQCHSILATYFRYAQRHLKSLEPSRISLSINAFYGIVVKIDAESEIPLDAPLIMSIPLHKEGDTSLPFAILETLTLHEFSCVTDLKLFYFGDLNPALGSFFCFFTSLRTIWGPGETFETLAALQNYINTTNEQTILFPSLKSITLNSYHSGLLGDRLVPSRFSEAILHNGHTRCKQFGEPAGRSRRCLHESPKSLQSRHGHFVKKHLGLEKNT